MNCNRDSADVNTVANCSLYSWAMESPNESFGNCSGELYSGGVCRQQLLEWQECAVGGGEEVLLDLTLMESSQEERERDASQFLHFISEWIHIPLFTCNCSNYAMIILINSFPDSFGSDYCQSVAGLLVCQSTFPLCDCATGHSYLASREECEKISMVECEEEWTIAKQYGIPLPTCTDLPEEVKSENKIG